MEDLPKYINQSIKKGYSELEIRKNLQKNGWQKFQIDAFFKLAKEENDQTKLTSNNKKNKKNNKSKKTKLRLHLRNGKLYLSVLALFVIFAAMIDIHYLNQPSKKISFSSVMTSFVQAMQDNNKQQLSTLLTATALSNFKTVNGSSNTYDCQQKNTICNRAFSASFIKSSKKSIKSYRTSKGLLGKKIVYTNSLPLTIKGCRVTELITISIVALPVNNSWKINEVKITNTTNKNSTCSTNMINNRLKLTSVNQGPLMSDQSNKSNIVSSKQSNQTNQRKNIAINQNMKLTNTQLQSKLNEINQLLRSYYSIYRNYPATLNPLNFISSNGALPYDVFKAPNGVDFVYNTAPVGCSSVLDKCSSYTFNAVASNGQVLASFSSTQ